VRTGYATPAWARRIGIIVRIGGQEIRDQLGAEFRLLEQQQVRGGRHDGELRIGQGTVKQQVVLQAHKSSSASMTSVWHATALTSAELSPASSAADWAILAMTARKW